METNAHLRIAQLLIDHGADVSAGGTGYTALRRAAEATRSRHRSVAAKGHTLARFLLDRGAAQDGEG